MARRFDTMAPDALGFAQRAIGPGFELGAKQAQQSQQFQQQFAADAVKSYMGNKRADKSVAVQEGYLKLAQQKQKLGVQAGKAREIASELAYKEKDNASVLGLQAEQFRFDGINSELSYRKQVTSMRANEMLDVWERDPKQKINILTGFDRESNTPTYLQHKSGANKGQFIEVDEEGWYRMNKDHVAVPEFGEGETSANPWKFRTTSELKTAMAKSEAEYKKLSTERVKLFSKEARRTGSDPTKSYLSSSIPNATTVDLMTQYTNVRQLDSLSDASKGSLMNDIKRMGIDEAKKMAAEQGGQEHFDWLNKFVEEQSLMPSVDMRASIAEAYLNDPVKAMMQRGRFELGKQQVRGQKKVKSREAGERTMAAEIKSAQDAVQAEAKRVRGEQQQARQAETVKKVTAERKAESKEIKSQVSDAEFRLYEKIMSPGNRENIGDFQILDSLPMEQKIEFLRSRATEEFSRSFTDPTAEAQDYFRRMTAPGYESPVEAGSGGRKRITVKFPE